MGVWIFTVALPLLVASACDVALIVTGPEGTAVGAVYRPDELIVSVVPPELIVHVTAVFVVPVTLAVNCWVCDGAPDRLGQRVFTELGLTVTAIGGGGGELLPPPQATMKAVRTSMRQSPAIL